MKNTLSVYFPDRKLDLVKRLQALGKKEDRSVNYLVLKAIEAYLKKEGG